MTSRPIVPARGLVLFLVLLVCCTGAACACGQRTEKKRPESASATRGARPFDAGKAGQFFASLPTPRVKSALPPKAPPPGLGALGELPAIAPAPAGAPDAAAAALAKQVLAGDAGSLPALMRAIDLAGFTIRHAGNTVQPPSGASQGLVFQAWEVQAISKLMGDGLATSFGETAALFAMLTKETATVPFDTLMRDGIRTSAFGKSPALRFWARFIVELGFQGPGTYDLLDARTPAKVNIDSVQTAFIFKRLAGDLAGLARNHAPKPAKDPDIHAAVRTGGAPSLVFASLRVPEPIGTIASTWERDGEAPSPCAVEGVVKEVQDIGAAVDNTAFGLLMERLEEKWGVAEAKTISKATGVANMVLAYLKLAATVALFDARVTMDGAAPPLTRTQSMTTNGAQRKLTVTVRMDHSKGQWVNCLRPMINRMGMDFDVPNAGAVADAEVNWELIRPRLSTVGGVRYGIVQFVGSDPVHVAGNITNKEGQSSIDIEGIKQRQEISPSAQQVRKQAQVYAHVKLKPASMYQDLKDAFINSGLSLNPLNGIPTVDPLGGIVTMPAELMYRTNWLFGGGLTFDVIDWSQGFTGNIIAIEQGRMDRQKGGGRDAFGFWSMSATYRDQRTLTVTGSSEMSPYIPEIGFAHATLDVGVDTDNVEQYQCTVEAISKCGDYWKAPGLRRVSSDGGSQRNRLSIGGTTQQLRAVFIKIFADGHYDITISLDSEPQVGEFTTTKDTFIDNAACTLQTITQNGPSKGSNRRFNNLVTVTGVLDPANPRVLKGNQILKDFWVDHRRAAADGCQGSARINTTITISWELAI